MIAIKSLVRRQKQLYIFISILLLGCGVFLFFSRKPVSRNYPVRCDGCNVVFVSFDALRADHTHFLGYNLPTTPTLDALAEKSYVFTNAVSVAPWTLPSTMSWFTGMYPSEHKILNKVTIDASGKEIASSLDSLSPSVRTLAEVFRLHGYRTGGFTGGAGVDHLYGFSRGFDMYTDDATFGGFNQSVPKALAWIQQNKDKELFIFLHGYDVHGQYVPEGGYDKRFVNFPYQGSLTGSAEEQKNLREEGLSRGKIFLTPDDIKFLKALYDEKIQRADAQFEKFLSAYRSMGLTDKTVFIITSDHGDELYDHGQIDHGHSLYDELLSVPLLIWLPTMKQAERIPAQVRSIDIMPTVLDIVNISADSDLKKQMSGSSLVPSMRGERQKLDVYPETDYRYAVHMRSIRTWDGWKYILNTETDAAELYQLSRDGKEQDNVLEQEPAIARSLRERLIKHIDTLK